MIMPKNIGLYLKVNRKVIALTPTGIKAMPLLTVKEILIVLAYLTAMRFSYIWWVGDLFIKSKQYRRIPYTLIRSMFASNNVDTPLKIAIKASETIEDKERRVELSPNKQLFIKMNYPNQYKYISQQAIDNKWSYEDIQERGQR